MRNTWDVLIEDKAGNVVLAVGVDRSCEDVAHFVRLDLHGTTLLLGPTRALELATVLQKHAAATL